MARPTIFKQLITNIIIPVCVGLVVIAISNYFYVKRNLIESYKTKNNILTNEIKHIMEFQDLALEIHEEMLEERMKKFSNELVNNYFRDTKNIENINLKQVQRQLGMFPELEDIYIINRSGIVVNTSFRRDYNLNFFLFGEEHKRYLLDIFNVGEFVSERFTIEARTKRLRKYTYQPTLDRQYIVEIGNYSKKADDIVEFIKYHLHKVTEEHRSIRSVDLFIVADNPFSLNKDAILIEDHKRVLKDIFETHRPQTFIINEDGKKMHYDYIYLDIRNTDLYKGAVIRIITDRTSESKLLKYELLKIILLFCGTLAIIVALIYIRSRGISLSIQHLVENIKQIAIGRYEERAKIEGNKEVAELSTQFNRMLDNIEARNIEAQNQQEKIEAQREQLIKNNKDLEKLSLVASKTNNAVSIYNTKGKLEWLNEGFQKLYGYSFNEVLYNIGDNIKKIHDNPDIDNLFNICVKTKQSVDFETKTKNKAGNEIWIQTTLSPILDKTNTINGVISIDSNITTIKYVESKLKEKNKDITDSIYYAKRIQEAILPGCEMIDEKFGDFFILLKPISIVSGDFFWYSKADKNIFLAAADCAGHGIPGAFMSLIGNFLLNKIVNEKKIHDPSEILRLLRGELHELLNKNQNNPISRDGIDIALCSFNHSSKQLQFAGSFNPIYILTEHDLSISKDHLKNKVIHESHQLYEIKPNRFPFAILKSNEKYITKNIKLKKGDRFYLFTDGFADQFGGPKNKKFKYNNFKDLFLQIQNIEFSKQKDTLAQKFEEWKGENDQVDDLLIAGFQI